MRRTCGLLALVLVILVPAAAKPTSLFEPRITLVLVETPLDEVLEAVSQQTGLRFDSPYQDVVRRVEQAQQQGGDPGRLPDLAQVRERMNPSVTLELADGSVAEAIDELEQQTGFEFRRMDDGSGYFVNFGGRRRDGAGEPGPMVKADDYLVHLAGVRLQRVHEVLFGEQARNQAVRRLEVFLTVDAPTDLARYGLMGLDREAEAVLDGELLNLPQGMSNQGLLSLGRLPGLRDPGYRLEFDLPEEAPGEQLDRLAGSLSVLPDLRELLFEFETLQPNEQRQTDGDIDLTVQPAGVTPAANREANQNQSRERGRVRRVEEPTVEIVVSRPVAGLVSMVMQTQSGDAFGARQLPGRNLPMVPPPGPPELMMGGMGLEATNERLYRGNFGASPLLPKVAIERPDGGLRLLPIRGMSMSQNQERLELRVQVATGELPAAAVRLWVAVLDSDGQAAQVPFVMADIGLPEAEEAPPPAR